LDYLPDETLLDIMLNMDGNTLLNFCATDVRTHTICNYEPFWKQKYILDFPGET